MDLAERLADCVSAGGTGGRDDQVGPPETVTDSDVTGHSIGSDPLHRQRVHPVGAPVESRDHLLLVKQHAAGTRSDDHANAIGVFDPDVQVTVLQGHLGAGQTKVHEAVDPLGRLLRYVLGGREPADLAPDSRREIASVEGINKGDAGTPLDIGAPEFIDPYAIAGRHTEAGDNNATFVHFSNSGDCSGGDACHPGSPRFMTSLRGSAQRDKHDPGDAPARASVYSISHCHAAAPCRW